MHLVVNQVMQLQEVHVADRDLALKGFAGTTIEQGHLAGGRHTGKSEHGLDFLFFGTVENRGCERHAILKVPGQFDDFAIVELIQTLSPALGIVDLV